MYVSLFTGCAILKHGLEYLEKFLSYHKCVLSCGKGGSDIGWRYQLYTDDIRNFSDCREIIFFFYNYEALLYSVKMSHPAHL